MDTAEADLICEVCTQLMRDPYTLPCGHTFCLRPCLLPHARATTTRCIRCHVKFGVDQLRPNYTIGARLCLLSSQWEQDHRQEQQVENKGEGVEGISSNAKGISESTCSSTRCSTCRRPVEGKELDICHHCQRNICPQCREKHCESYGLVIRVKLNALSRHKTNLKSRLEEMRGCHSLLSGADRTTKDSLIAALEDAVLQLRRSAGKSLDAATAKLEVMDVESSETTGPLLQQIMDLSSEMGKTKDACALLKGSANLLDLVTMQRSMEKLFAKAASLGIMMKNLPPQPITKTHLSDKFNQIDQHLRDFDLVVGDGLVMLPQPPPPVNTGTQKRNVTTSNTTVQKSRVKLYVGGLRPNHTEGQLRRHFAQYGTVTDCHIVRDPKTDESKCFGFVTFQEETHATRALADCPHFIQGGPVDVKASIIKTKAEKEKMPVSSAAVGMDEKLESTVEGSGIGGWQEVDKLRLFVGNLNPSTTQQALKEHFSHYGNVTRVDVILERGSRKPRGIAFMSMGTPQEVDAILEARPHQLSGESIIVRPAYLRPSGEAKVSKVVKNGCQSAVPDLSLQRGIRVRHRGRSVYPRVGTPSDREART